MARILVVEDDKDLLFLYETALSSKGHEVTVAGNSAQALKLLADPNFFADLAIMDMGMPDTPGTLAVEAIRNNPRFSNTKIVVVTANEHYQERLVNQHVDRFIVKPINISMLVDLIDSILA